MRIKNDAANHFQFLFKNLPSLESLPPPGGNIEVNGDRPLIIMPIARKKNAERIG